MLFVGMLVFQLAGALILLINSINGSKGAVIKNCFPGSNIVERDDYDNCVLPKENLRNSAHRIHLNIIAFFDLVIGYGIAAFSIGYGIAAFSPCAAYPTICTVIMVLGVAILLSLIEYVISRLVACIKYRGDLIVAYRELEKHGVETITTNKEITEMINSVFKD